MTAKFSILTGAAAAIPSAGADRPNKRWNSKVQLFF